MNFLFHSCFIFYDRSRQRQFNVSFLDGIFFCFVGELVGFLCEYFNLISVTLDLLVIIVRLDMKNWLLRVRHVLNLWLNRPEPFSTDYIVQCGHVNYQVVCHASFYYWKVWAFDISTWSNGSYINCILHWIWRITFPHRIENIWR